jgi:hypothetical protein
MYWVARQSSADVSDGTDEGGNLKDPEVKRKK